MLRTDFHYELPEALIAQHPLPERGASRMLRVAADGLGDDFVRSFPAQIGADDLVVFNDTRVIPARLHGTKESGGRIEILVERMTGPRSALAHVRASKPLRAGGAVAIGGARVVMTGREGALFALELVSGADTFAALLDAHGEVPLPPYIERSPEVGDVERYQTVFARNPGAVAAPTAGLHFSEAMLAEIAATGARVGYVTLHVGAGTFQPVRENDLSRHHMHAERLVVSPELVDAVDATRARGGRVVAVGTTVVRALEAAAADGTLRAFDGDTQLFITPGYRYRVVDALLTNFHLPESTLLMLVCAFAGYERVMAAYRHAVDARYRFFSYGDAMWLPARIDG